MDYKARRISSWQRCGRSHGGRRRWTVVAPRSSALVLGSLLLMCAPASATDVTGTCPAGGFTLAGSPWNLTGDINIPLATTCTVQAGATLTGNAHSITVQGTLNAVGTGSAQRDIVFNSLRVFYTSGGGTLQFC